MSDAYLPIYYPNSPDPTLAAPLDLGPGEQRGGVYIRLEPRRALSVEYIGLIAVFTAYAFVDQAWIAVGLAYQAAGAADTLLISASVDAGTGGQTISNSASVTAVDQSDSSSGNDSAIV